MRPPEVRRRRLQAHHLTPRRRLGAPVDVVRSLLALQAQDYRQSLWAVGARLRPSAGGVAAVEAAVAKGEIVRTWPMRGTIHLLAAEDARWMVRLGRPRMRASFSGRLAELGVTPADVTRAAGVVAPVLADGPASRAVLLETLTAAGLPTEGQQGYHVLVQLALDEVICLGPVRGTTQTFALMDTWVPTSVSRDLSGDDAVTEAATRFARGRGPVTAHDLARWTGLTVTTARAGLESAGLARAGDFWFDDAAPAPRASASTLLLAGFDEYLIGYKGRDDVLDPTHFERIVPGGNGVYRPMIVRDGEIVGTWAREVKPKRATVTLAPFEAWPGVAEDLAPELERYRGFLGVPELVVSSPG